MTPPFFLVGCPRSGTTLLQQMLDAHPRVAVAPETFFVNRQWARREEWGDLSDDAALDRWLDQFVASDEFSDTKLTPDDFRRDARLADRNWPGQFAALLEAFRRSRGADAVGEKTPNHLFAMRQLEDWFPGCRFVHIVRDPRAVTASWRHVPWTTRLRVGDADVWRQYAAAARRTPPRSQGSLFTVHYEALVASPEKVLRDVCAFLALDFDTAMLRHHEQEIVGVDLAREPWKQAAAGPVSGEATGRWREELSAAEVRDIEAVAWNEMRRLGYHPVTGALGLALAWPRVRAAVHAHRWRGRWRRNQRGRRRERTS